MLLVCALFAACDDAREGSGLNPPSATRPPSGAPTTHGPTDSSPEFPRTLHPPRTPDVVAPDQLPVGRPPRVQYAAWLEDPEGPWPTQVVVMPNGRIAATLQVDRQGNEGYRHLSFAPYAGGWLTMFDSFGALAMLVGLDGAMRNSIGAGPGHVFSRPGRQEIVFEFIPSARLGFGREVATLGAYGLRRLGRAGSSAGFLGAHEVVVTTRDGVYRIDMRNRTRTLVPGLSAATMASSRAGRLIGVSEGAHGVYDARTGAPILGSPSYRLRAFSPSGDLVVGYRRAPGRSAELVLADVESGQILQSFRWRPHGRPEQIVWEDDRAVLVDFVRFRLDGTIEAARLLQPSGLNLLPPPIS